MGGLAESTTSLEAWLLGKQTFYINPTGAEFQTYRIYKGHPIFKSYSEIQNAINEYYKDGSIPGFIEKKEIRKRIIQDVIQWCDGKNHLRAAYYIEKLLRRIKTNRHKRFTLEEMKKAYFSHLFFVGGGIRGIRDLPRFKKYKKARNIFSNNQLLEIKNKYRIGLEKFYSEDSLTEKDLNELVFINR